MLTQTVHNWADLENANLENANLDKVATGGGKHEPSLCLRQKAEVGRYPYNLKAYFGFWFNLEKNPNRGGIKYRNH